MILKKRGTEEYFLLVDKYQGNDGYARMWVLMDIESRNFIEVDLNHIKKDYQWVSESEEVE